MIVTTRYANGEKRIKRYAIDSTYNKILVLKTEKTKLEKEQPTIEDRRNMVSQREAGIAFFEEGNRIEKLTEEEYNNLGFYFKQGYEIARRREYAKKLTK